MAFFLLSLQQKHDTPQAMIIIKQTLTAPTISSSFRFIWQFFPANQGLQLQDTSVLASTHCPFLLQSSHSVLAPEQTLPGSRVLLFRSRYPGIHVQL